MAKGGVHDMPPMDSGGDFFCDNWAITLYIARLLVYYKLLFNIHLGREDLF